MKRSVHGTLLWNDIKSTDMKHVTALKCSLDDPLIVMPSTLVVFDVVSF